MGVVEGRECERKYCTNVTHPWGAKGGQESGRCRMKVYTFSELQQSQSCEREYAYRYVDLLQPRFDGLPKPVGGALHAGVEALYNGKGSAETLAEAKEYYWKDIPEELRVTGAQECVEDAQLQKVFGGWLQVKAMLEQYPWKDQHEMLTNEAALLVPMGHGRALRLKIDRTMLVNGGLWIHDTKTTGFQMAPMVKIMRLRHQFAGYVWAVQQWLAGGALEGPPPPEGVDAQQLRGVIADMVQKPRVYWKQKNKQPTGEVTVQRAEYHREPLHVTAGHVEEFAKWFHTCASRVEAAGLEECWVKNTDNCFKYNSVCAMFELCRNPARAAQIANDEQLFTKREHKHSYYDKD